MSLAWRARCQRACACGVLGAVVAGHRGRARRGWADSGASACRRTRRHVRGAGHCSGAHGYHLRTVADVPVDGRRNRETHDRHPHHRINNGALSSVRGGARSPVRRQPDDHPRPEGPGLFLVGLLACTGVRIGEALGLHRGDMHLLASSGAVGCGIEGPHVHARCRARPRAGAPAAAGAAAVTPGQAPDRPTGSRVTRDTRSTQPVSMRSRDMPRSRVRWLRRAASR